MATITKPMALDESFNTTESTPRNQADVLVGIEQAIVRGFGQVANAVSYDNTDSGLTADNVQDAIDEVDDTVDGLVDDVTEISSDIESTQTTSGNPITLTDAAPINAESLVVELEPKQEGSGDPSPTNIRPITGYTECEVEDVGKNLFDIDSLIAGNIDNNGYDYADGHATYRRTPYIRLKAGNYVIKRIGNTSEWWKGYLYNSQNDHDGIGFVFNTNTDSVSTFTAQTDCWLRIAFDYTPTTADQIQLESGSQPTTFVPYSSTSASIQFGQTVYGGKSNFTEGGTDVTYGYAKKDTPIADFSGTNPTYGKYVAYTIADCDNTQQDKVDYLCSNVPVTFDVFLITTHRYGNTFFVYVPTTWSVSDYNSIIVPDLEFSYPLDTENTISTPPSPLKLLKGTNNITTNGTTINLGYQPDNVIGEVKGEIEKCAVDAEFMQFTDGTDTFTDVNLSLDALSHTVSVVGSKIEQKRFICFEVMDKMGGVLQGILASCIAFTDGAKTPSGTAFRAYIESLQMYVNFRIYGSGGSYTLAYQSETSFSASAFYVRVRLMNNL